MTSATLLLLHPLGSDGGFWAPVAELLDRTWLAPDLPGHGTAAPPSPATLATYVEAAAAAVEDRDTGPVVAIGISLGGLVAQGLVARRPDLVSGLVLVDTVSVYPSPFRDTWPERAGIARTDGLAPLADPMSEMWFSAGFREARPDVVAATRERFLATDAEGYARTCEVLHAVDTSGVVPVDLPMLVVCGEHDAPAFLDAARALAAASGSEVVWLPGARHASVLERPREFTVAVLDFLAAHGL